MEEMMTTRVMAKYAYEYVFDVYDVSGKYAESGYRLFEEIPVETFNNYEWAAFNWPRCKVVARPVLCTCLSCGTQTKVSHFKTLEALHTKDCENNRRTASGDFQADTQAIP